LELHAANTKGNTDLWDAMDALRADWTESGTIYNGFESDLISEVFPGATQAEREVDPHTFGPPVMGMLNSHEPDENAIGPMVLNRAYVSNMDYEATVETI